MEGEHDFSKIRNEIDDLDTRARALEKWLIENLNDPKYFDKKNEYDDVLFRMAQKRLKIESITNGYRPPETGYTIQR